MLKSGTLTDLLISFRRLCEPPYGAEEVMGEGRGRTDVIVGDFPVASIGFDPPGLPLACASDNHS